MKFHQRDGIIRWLYRELRLKLHGNPQTIFLPHVGLLDVPQGLPPRNQAARMIHADIAQYVDPDPPAEERITRIASTRS